MAQESQPIYTDTLIIGGGPAGLAVAACLRQANVDFIILERATHIAPAWHQHYERLHLHTDKAHSSLPYFPLPADYPRYPSRQQVVDYLEAYRAHFRIEPLFRQTVTAVRQTADGWQAQTADTTYAARSLVVATGGNGQPIQPTWPGQDTYAGEIVHSAAYRSGEAYRGKRVLVVGFGNSGGEIAIDLHEHGAQPTLAVRSPVNIIPRELFGIPILYIAIPQRRFPAWLSDAINAPVALWKARGLSGLGLRKAGYGVATQIRQKHRIPLIDIGTIKLIREGHIPIRPGIERFTINGVVFNNGVEEPFDAVILATGYRPAIDFLSGVPDGGVVSGKETVPGLYFCGFFVSPTGMLREIGIEAKHIAQSIAAKTRVSA
jgi:indole-3-pyruvate monooxygenase